MAAKSKKRLPKTENKLLEYDKLQLKEVVCSICQSILLEPVTLPCLHNFCQSCFKGSIENNALCCPLCRLRIGSWLRTATKQNKTVNERLWGVIKSKFAREVEAKLRGEDLVLSQEESTLRVSAPGEIRSEYEDELSRLKAERLHLEKKQLQATQLLIRKIKEEEEEEAHKQEAERLKQDEILAQQIQQEQLKRSIPGNTPRKHNAAPITKNRLKPTKIDSYLRKIPPKIFKNSPMLTDDNSNSTDSITSKMMPVKIDYRGSPEIVPSYGKYLKNFLDKKVKNVSGFWNKENGENCKSQKTELLAHSDNKGNSSQKNVEESQSTAQSVPVSLLYSGILQHKINALDKRSTGSSVDSMRQELCYFKPIQGTTVTCFSAGKGLPLRVPGVRPGNQKPTTQLVKNYLSHEQYVESLCRLRSRALEQNLPSAFALAHNMLTYKKDCPVKTIFNTKSKVKKATATSPCPATTSVDRGNVIKCKHSNQMDGVSKLNPEPTTRRTRSMGSIPKDENETTPKKNKTKVRKVSSERKPYLRSDSKKMNAKKNTNSPPLFSETVNNNKINLAVKNLSSPLKNCDVKKIVEEQLRIVKIIEQEKSDLELARKMDAEWNERHLRRPAVKRQVTLNYALRPAKKLKV